MCDCIKLMDEKLANHNGRIALGTLVTKDLDVVARILVATEKLDTSKRKPVPKVVASFCPFCGEKAEGAPR